MLKYTKHNLKKIEQLFEQLNYTVRYERGNFQSGYCLVEDRRIVVINKFYDTEARMTVLLEILSEIDADPSRLEGKSAELYHALLPEDNS